MEDDLARSLISASPDALWLLRVDGSTLYGNARLEALLGRPVADLSARSILDLTDEQGSRDLTEHLARMSAHHPGNDNEEVLLFRPDGSSVWTLVSWRPAYDDDGELIGYLHRLTEYTERRELLDRLRRRETELDSAQTIAHLGSWSFDIAAGRCTWSPELYRIYDRDPDDFEPSLDNFLASAHPDDREMTRAVIEQAMREGDSYSFEGRIVTPGGEVRWTSASGVVERDRDGTATVLHGTCQDVTALHGAADEARHARRRLMLFSSIAEAANRSVNLEDALARAHDALRSVDEWRALAVWSRPDPDDLPVLVHDLSSPNDVPHDPHAVAAVPSWETGHLTVESTPHTSQRTVWLPVRLSGRTFRLIHLEGRVEQADEAVRVLLDQVSGTLSRVAEREQAAIELAVARDDAMAASAHKSAFLATMSHEIRTPMNGVIGLTDLLLRTDLDAHQQRLADGLQGAGLTLLALINDILDLTKIESGAVELEHAPFEVCQVLDQTATIISAPAQEKRLELVLSLDPGVPAVLMGDHVRLGQVLTNLASNAVKFTDRGEVVVELSLGAGPGPGRILLRGEVRDTGIGIGPDPSSLFEAFTQADLSTTRSHGGTGLGLAIARRLVHDMGGSIGADERPGGGSVFWFTVPVDLAPDHDAAPSLLPLERRRALVVDDNAEAANAIVRQLSAWGLDVTSVDSAQEALSLLRAAAGTDHAYGLALVDLHMPQVDGLALGRAITSDGELAGLPMILLSDDPSSRADEIAAVGFSTVVDKPLRLTELHEAILEATLDTGTRSVVTASGRRRPSRRDELALHVLVVEDNPVNQLVAQGLLESLGCTSAVAANGEEALEVLTPGHDFDLVLMDCRMPRMDGYVATTLVRAQERGTRVPIVAMTASALTGERDRCLAAGMDDFLTKPVDPASLTRCLGRWSGPREDRSVREPDGPQRVDAPPASAAADARPSDPSDPGDLSDPGAPADQPVLDSERVEMLRELVRDGVDFFERTRASFLSRIDATLVALRQACDEEDLDQVHSIAHQLKGSALNLGLPRAGTAAGELERAARARDTAATLIAVGALEHAVAEAVQALAETAETAGTVEDT